MAGKAIVFQHNPWEGPGRFLLAAAKRNRIELEIIRLWEEAIPDISNYAAMIVLGGGANVDQEHIYPFLIQEKKTIKKAIARDMPYLGFCLGHQLLAEALGATVGPNFQSSIGYIKGFLTHAGRVHPVLANLPQKMMLFKWHSQAVREPVPGHINILVTSADCQVEAISLPGRPHILGLQFDNHAADAKDVKQWLTMDANWLSTLQDRIVDPGALLAEAQEYQADIRAEFIKLFDNFFSLIH